MIYSKPIYILKGDQIQVHVQFKSTGMLLSLWDKYIAISEYPITPNDSVTLVYCLMLHPVGACYGFAAPMAPNDSVVLVHCLLLHPSAACNGFAGPITPNDSVALLHCLMLHPGSACYGFVGPITPNDSVTLVHSLMLHPGTVCYGYVSSNTLGDSAWVTLQLLGAQQCNKHLSQHLSHVAMLGTQLVEICMYI